MSKPRRVSRWALIAVLWGGAMFQATGCEPVNQLAADLTASWATSIADNLISSWMSQRFRVPSSSFSSVST
jgi:hypothetical protein